MSPSVDLVAVDVDVGPAASGTQDEGVPLPEEALVLVALEGGEGQDRGRGRATRGGGGPRPPGRRPAWPASTGRLCPHRGGALAGRGRRPVRPADWPTRAAGTCHADSVALQDRLDGPEHRAMKVIEAPHDDGPDPTGVCIRQHPVEYRARLRCRLHLFVEGGLVAPGGSSWRSSATWFLTVCRSVLTRTYRAARMRPS